MDLEKCDVLESWYFYYVYLYLYFMHTKPKKYNEIDNLYTRPSHLSGYVSKYVST